MIKIKFIKDLSIKNKIIAIILMVTILTISLGFTFIAFWDINRIKSNIQSNLVLNAKLVGDYCVVPLTFGDQEQATEALSRLQYIEFIEIGCLYDKTGKLFAKYPDTLNENSFLVLSEQHNNKFTDGHFYVSEPVMFQNELYGTLYIEANSDHLIYVVKTKILTLSLIILVLVFFSVILAGRLQRFISIPILKLKNHIDYIAEIQDFSVRLTKQNNDEIGSLYDGFNNLLEQINKGKKERDKASESLRKSESKLRETQSLAHLGSWFWDVKSGSVEWSEEVYNIFGLDLNKFTPNRDSILALSPWPEENKRDQELINRAIETKSPGSYEQKFLRPDKSIGHYYSTFQGNFNKNGDLISIRGTLLDITKRKQAEIELKKHQEHLEELVKERTEKLEEINKELENMNSVFVDREYRIKELKERLEKFENK